jgi:long-chain acyl-CoA synthetase
MPVGLRGSFHDGGVSTRAVLITGTTGFVGMELLARFLERSDRPVIAPVRAADDGAAADRVDGVLRGLFGPAAARHRERVDAVAADLTAPGLGLERRRQEELAERVGLIIHSAASISFTLPLDEARAINLDGTSRVLELAELARDRGGLEHLCHVSTAYVSGTHVGRFRERDLDVGQGFRNTYEQSKFEAERLVREHSELPTTIVRPSIVVGDRRSGWTAAFNVLYWPLRAFSRGLYPAVPAVPSSPVDVVSIDYVADAIYDLSARPGGAGETYHLTAGDRASNIAELAELASRYFDRPPPKVLTPDEFASFAASATGLQRSALEESHVFFPYFSIRTVFDDARARARLEPAGIRVSPLPDYLERLLDFATRTRWGKRPLSRAAAFAG